MTGSFAPRIEISRAAIANNLHKLRERAPVPTLAMVKANAYGHGLDPVARVLTESGSEYLGVAEVEDAYRLAEGGFGPSTFLVGPANRESLLDLSRLGVTIAASSLEGCSDLAEIAPEDRPGVHIALDGGLHRLGLMPTQIDRAIDLLVAAGVRIEGVFTHPATADVGDWARVEHEVKWCREVADGIRRRGVPTPLTHHGGSSLYLERPDLMGDMGRPGIAIYGCYPSSRQLSLLSLTPALSLIGTVVETRELPAGESVGYGPTYEVEHDSTIATVALGTSHGLDERLAQRGFAAIGSEATPFVGSISLEYSTLDVTGTATQPGDEVLVYGGATGTLTSVASVAKLLDTAVDNVLSRLSPRIQRQLIDE